MRQIDLTHLRTFVLVAEGGSFTGAASGARRTQPTVSRQVRALEQALGVPLFLRTGRTPVLTEAGHRLLGYARRLMALLEETREAVVADGERAARRLRVGAGGMPAQYLLPPLLGTLRARRPDVTLTIATHHPETVVLQVARGELDAGLVTRPVRASGLALLPVGEDEMVATVAAGHPWSRLPPRRLPPHAFAGEPFILYDRGTGTSRRILGYLARHGVEPQVAMEVGYIEAVKEMVKIGLGASLLPGWVVAREVAAGEIAAVRLAGGGLRRVWTVVVPRRGASRGGSAAGAVDELLAVCREQLPGLLAGGGPRRDRP